MINIHKKYDFVYYIILIIFFVVSFFFSKQYSIYNTDFIHWSFILEQVISYLNGNHLYKDIFLQYGEGQVVFLSFINSFYKIDIYTIGIISALVFGLKFFLVFQILKKIIISRVLAFICTSLIFFSITYSQIPWPDLYSGLFLLIFFYLFIINFEKENILITILSSFIFFLTIYFRNTYILNFLLSVIVYFFYETLFIKKRNIYIYKIFLITFFFLVIYLIVLSLNDNLSLWFEQGFGLSDHYFGVVDINLIDRIKNYLFFIARLIYHILIPKNLVNIFFTFCILFNCIYLFFGNLFINQNQKIENSLIKFLSIYGLCGLVQLLSHYEIIRYINASISLFIVSFYFIEKIKILPTKKKLIIIFLFSFFYLFNIIKFFPLSSHNHKITNFPITSYDKSNINFFGDKKLSGGYLNYYEDIILVICQKDYIYNLTWDKSFNFICNEKKNIYKYNMFLGDQKLIENLQNGENLDNRIILSSNKLQKLKLIKIKRLPKYFRYTKADTYMQFYPDVVYLYE